MKVAVICNSDSLAFPAVNQLHVQQVLAGVAVPLRSSRQLLGPLLSIGVSRDRVQLLDKKGWCTQMGDWLSRISADAVWVFGFPWLIPASLLNSVSLGFFNFHFGELPKYKGADPIFWQLRNNEAVATLTVHKMTEDIDAGPVVLQKQLPQIKGENYGLLCQRLGFMAAELLPQLLGNVKPFETVLTDETAEPTAYFKKPGSEELKIKWHEQSADEIECLVNAANPKYDGATTWIRNAEVRILEASPAEIQLQEGFKPEPGTIVYADAVYGLIVACRESRFLKINMVHMREGYFSGSKLFSMGIKAGEKFFNLN